MLFVKQPEPETLNSRLLPDLFDVDKLEEGLPIRVVDFGVARSHTFQFLSQFNCHLQVIDIKNKLLVLNEMIAGDPEQETVDVEAALIDALGLGDGEMFDVCLVWDFLNYLDSRCLRAFSRVLLPHLSENAKLHGFAVLNKNTPLTEQSYGVVDTELLIVSDQRNVALPYRHSQSAIKDTMVGITIKQSILRSDGRLEMILSRP